MDIIPSEAQRMMDGMSLRRSMSDLKHNAIVYSYTNGVVDIIHTTGHFMEAGWEEAGAKPTAKPRRSREKGKVAEGDDLTKSMSRARAKLRRLALANDFKYFVTLTLDPEKIDRDDGAAVAKALGRWADNMVRRKGLKYILVPELHKKGGIHFHGFMNDPVEVVDSGTIKLPGAKKPRKPRSQAQRAEWLAGGGQVVYNLPQWSLGFSTALELWGEYPNAVAYVCKYIGKDKQRPMGRWYYSGGDLAEPTKVYADLERGELLEEYCGKAVEFNIPGAKLTIIHTKMEGNHYERGQESNGQQADSDGLPGQSSGDRPAAGCGEAVCPG